MPWSVSAKKVLLAFLQTVHAGVAALVAFSIKEPYLLGVLSWVYVVVFILAAVLSQLRIAAGWAITLSMVALSACLSLIWLGWNVLAYYSGAPLYQDSPASIIVALIGGLIGLVPSAAVGSLLWAWRNDLRRARIT